MEQNESLCVKNSKRLLENKRVNLAKSKLNISGHGQKLQTSTNPENINFASLQKNTYDSSEGNLSTDSDEESSETSCQENKNSDEESSESQGKKKISSNSDEEGSETLRPVKVIKVSSTLDENQSQVFNKIKKENISYFDNSNNDNIVNEQKGVCQNEVKEKNLLTDLSENKNNTHIESENSTKSPVKFASIVAAYYNSVDSKIEGRTYSKIWYLRNFNNWIKTNLLDDSVTRLQGNQYYRNLKVLDMCCGKGGDIIKWLKLNVRYLVMTDIAEISLKECKERFAFLLKKIAGNSDIQQEVILADCTRDRLRSKYKDPSIQFDIVSCQFSFHYCFESLPQAECMLKNAAECLKPGGFFIGTLPNADEIVKRLTVSNTTRLENHIFSLEMIASKPYALFGAKYNFKLEGVVDCPEFLVHFPAFERLAGNFGLKLIDKKRFDEIYEEKKKTGKGEALLKKMKALETYPPLKEDGFNKNPEDYIHAKVAWEMKGSEGPRLGTLSKSEWEVITLYIAFIFQKQKTN